MMKTQIIPAALVVLASGAAAQAQDMSRFSFGVEAGVSTLGLFVAPDVEVAPNFHLRAPLFYGQFSGDIEYDGNDGDGEVSIVSGHVMGDYYVWRGLRVSGGVSFGGYEFEGTFVNPTLDGQTYNATITGFLEQEDDIVPVLSIGYQHSFNERWGMSAELGARITSMDLRTTGQDGLPATQQDDFNADIREINDDLDDIKVLPFLSLGVTYRF